MGLSEMLGLDLQAEIQRKMEINRKRKYVMKNGVMQKVEGVTG